MVNSGTQFGKVIIQVARRARVGQTLFQWLRPCADGIKIFVRRGLHGLKGDNDVAILMSFHGNLCHFSHYRSSAM